MGGMGKDNLTPSTLTPATPTGQAEPTASTFSLSTASDTSAGGAAPTAAPITRTGNSIGRNKGFRMMAPHATGNTTHGCHIIMDDSSSKASSTNESFDIRPPTPTPGGVHTNGHARYHQMAQFAGGEQGLTKITTGSSFGDLPHAGREASAGRVLPIRSPTASSSSLNKSKTRKKQKGHQLNPTRTDYIDSRGRMIRPSKCSLAGGTGGGGGNPIQVDGSG